MPDGTTPIDGATKRINHQLFTYNPHAAPGTSPYGGQFPPQKFYELVMQETQHKLHPDYSPTTVWGFDGQVPGPLFRQKYGEPILVRFHNHLPSVKVPQAFGIAEMTTHLHNGAHPVGERRQPGQLLQFDQRPQRHQSARVQGPALSERPRRLHGPGQQGRRSARGAELAVVPRSPPRFHRPERL